jgi:hypothetical protein
MQRIALLDIYCGICCKTGHYHVTAAIAPNRSHATQPAHTKPGRRHEKASWLHQEISVVYMVLG